jgi:hypothetical protein
MTIEHLDLRPRRAGRGSTEGTQMQRPGIRKRRLRGDRGAAVVEFAVVLPILMLIVCSIIDFGTSYNDYQALRGGVRDGTRDSVVTNYGTNVSCHDSTQGPTPGTPALNIICHVKDRAGLGNKVRVGVWAPSGWDIGKSVRVCAQVFANSTTGVTGPFLDGRVITAKVDMRIEQKLPASATSLGTPTEETPLSTTWPSGCNALP